MSNKRNTPRGGLPRSEANTDPARARKRAAADLRCAVRKLGVAGSLDVLTVLISEHAAKLHGAVRITYTDIADAIGRLAEAARV